jgi:spermidine synthase
MQKAFVGSEEMTKKVLCQKISPFQLTQHTAKGKFLKRLFKFARFYTGPVPTYPGGTWCYFYLSDQVSPLKKIKKEPLRGLRYYNFEIHRAAFTLPHFFSRAISKSTLGGDGQ